MRIVKPLPTRSSRTTRWLLWPNHRAYLPAVLAAVGLGAVFALSAVGCGVATSGSIDSGTDGMLVVATVSPAASETTSSTEQTTTAEDSVVALSADADSGPPPWVHSATAQALGEYAAESLAKAGKTAFVVVKADELAGLGDTVIDIVLDAHPDEAGAKGYVGITICNDPLGAAASSTESPVSMTDDEAEAAARVGYKVEDLDLPNVSSAALVTGPFGSYCQLIARLPGDDGRTINILSDTGQLKGGELPLDRTDLETLLSALLEKVR
jgi:hypothetical protein